MKKILLTGLALSAAMIAGQANAATAIPLTAAGIPNWASTVTPTPITAANYSETFIAGSSAATPFLEQALRVNCSGTIYRYAAGGSFAYLCSKADTFTSVTTPFLLIHKRDGGGSINGVTAAKGTQQIFINVSTIPTATTCAAPAVGISKCSGGTVAENSSSALKPSELNLADVDPAQFQSPINGGVANAATGLTTTAVATQIFGVAVNTLLRDAIQDGMIRGGLLPASCVTAGVHSETEACMPNLTTAQISTIFANNGFTDWSNLAFSRTDGTLAGYLYPTAATQPNNTNIHICARTAGSGTWATMNIKFENAPCNGTASQAYVTSSAQSLSNETSLTNGAQKVVHAMSGSGDVESCFAGLQSAAASGTFTPYPAMINGGSAPGASNARWAIGIIGVERNASGSLPYRFVKIDGFAPNAQNVVEGKYKFWAELVNMVGTTPTSDQLAIALLAEMSNPISIASLNVTQTWGAVTGFLGEATNANTALLPTNYTPAANGSATLLNAAFDSTRPVNPFTHATSAGADLNHCRVPTIPAGTRVLPAY